MKVLHVLDERFLHPLHGFFRATLRELDARGVENFVLAKSLSGDRGSAISTWTRADLQEVLESHRRFPFIAIHVHFGRSWHLFEELDAMLGEEGLELPTMLSLHGTDLLARTSKKDRTLFAMADRCSKITAPSVFATDILEGLLGFQSRLAEHLRTPIDVDAVERAWEVTDDLPRSGTIWAGRAIPVKDPLLAIAAARRHALERPEWRLKMVVSIRHGDLGDRIDEATRGSSVIDLQSTMDQTSLLVAMRGATSVLSTSHRTIMGSQEAMGLTLVEGMAMGCVPIAIDEAGPRETMAESPISSPISRPDVDAVVKGLELGDVLIDEDARAALRRAAIDGWHPKKTASTLDAMYGRMS